MAGNGRAQRLELTWFNKDKALIPTENGKYGYQWVDPRDPRYCQTHTLVMGDYVEGVQAEKVEGTTYSERADLEPTTDNLLINGESGDVLEALTRVPELVDRYVGQVKLCYIDPPFNTSKAFAHYEDNLEHSIWLTMMRDRLVHIKKLLAADGSIWVHLDDSENHRMRVLLDEVFGPGNFLTEIHWEKKASREGRSAFSVSNDIILVYGMKSSTEWKTIRNFLPRTDPGKNPDDDPRGNWIPVPMSAQGYRPNQMYEIVTPTGKVHLPPAGGCWRAVRERYETLLAAGRIFFPRGGDGQPVIKNFISESAGLVPHTGWKNTEVGSNSEGKREIQALFPGQDPFDTPKPERLLERIIHIATNPGDIVLDVFAGSGTTAAVAHKMGRRWVTCELLESNFSTFTLPRLTKVVRGEDPGGITTTAGERVDATEDGLPEGLSPEEAQKLTSLLNKAIKGRDDLKKDKTIREVKNMVKTRNSGDVINWRGGGGFRVATLSPACFDYDPDLGLVTLTPAAMQDDNLARSVAAHLNFHLTPDDPVFTGIRGRIRLAVIAGSATPSTVDELLPFLEEGQTLVIAATSVDPDTAQYMRKVRKGSRVLSIPNDLFRAPETED